MSDRLATQIRAARKQSGLSREGLAAELGVSLSTIVRYETGRTERIQMATLLGIAKATKQPLSYFLEAA